MLSPSWCAPAHFPDIHEQALRRIRAVLELEPVEFPTTRRPGTATERAADLMAAFADPTIRAIFATIGGDDQITLIRHLDPGVVRSDPQPFFGYSDNTNVLNWLWRHGVGGYHGGSTQVHLGPGPQPDDVHLTTLRAALFGGGDVPITPLPASADSGVPWADPGVLATPTLLEATAEGWSWHGARLVVRGPTWGGNLEVLQWVLAAGHAHPDPAAYDGCVMLLETSEERPGAPEVTRMMRVLGERGLLERAGAVLLARAKASEHDDDPGPAARADYRRAQRSSVLDVMARYAPDVPTVVGVEFGHTHPQWVLPYGGEMTVDSAAQRITAHFGGAPERGEHPQAQVR